MPRYRVEINLTKGGNIKTVQKAVERSLPEGGTCTVTKDDPPSSRADRLSAAMSTIEDVRSEVEELRDELQNWVDNLPENLQQGSKADEINDAIQELDNLVSELDGIDGSGVSFPGMY